MKFKLFFFLLMGLGLIGADCSKKTGVVSMPSPGSEDSAGHMDYWLTTPDQAALLKKQTADFSFATFSSTIPVIDVDTTALLQMIDGFGFTLTGGSANVIDQLSVTARTALLNELFGADDNSIGISYLRLSMGASDLDASVFSYDDLPSGQVDSSLNHFSLDPDRKDLIPLLHQILLLRPDIKILATPWSPPTWMKDNGSSVGGSLQPAYYGAYARYFLKYIQGMRAEGIRIDAITPQNEPLNPANNPSMVMTAGQETVFVRDFLGPLFRDSAIDSKIILYDHNCDHPDYPLSILNDAGARSFAYGSAFHLYAGDISVLSQVHTAFPDKQLYFTEQYTASTSGFADDLKWHVKNVIIGAIRNWSRTALEWNLADDPSFGPHTPGGCNTCKGALTIGSGITRNVGYYILAHASKFVPPGSVHVGSNITAGLENVAFKTPDGRKVLIVENDGSASASFHIRFGQKSAAVSLPAGAVGTYRW